MKTKDMMTPHHTDPTIRRIMLLLATLGVLVAGLAGPASAADDAPGSSRASAGNSGGITVGIRTGNAEGGDRRGVYKYEILPRGVVQDWVAVSNYRDKPVTVRLFAKDATSDADTAFRIQPSEERPTDVGSWIALKQNRVTIPAKTELSIPFQLGVPFNATPGDHAGAIVVSLLSREPKPDGRTVIVDNRVAMRVYLRVPGDLKPAVAIDDPKVSWDGERSPSGRGTAVVSYTVRNTGNVRLDVDGAVELSRAMGLPNVKGRAAALTDLLPGGSAPVRVRIPAVLGTGPMTASIELTGTPTDPKLSGTASAEESVSFGAWPWLLLMLVALGLVLLGTGGWFWRRRWSARQAAEAADAAAEESARAAAKHRLPVARLAVRAAGITAAALVAGGVSVAGLAPAAQAAPGDRWQATITDEAGKPIKQANAAVPFYLTTSGGCPKPATNVVGFGYGVGFPKEGAVVVSNIDGPVSNERGFAVALVDNMINLMAAQPAPQQLTGTYTFVLRCIEPEFVDKSYGEYVTSIRFDSPAKYVAPPPLTTKKGPTVQIPTTGKNGEPRIPDRVGKGATADPSAGGTAAGELSQAEAAERAQQLLDAPEQESGSGTNWPLIGGGVVVAALSLLVAFGRRLPWSRRKSTP